MSQANLVFTVWTHLLNKEYNVIDLLVCQTAPMERQMAAFGFMLFICLGSVCDALANCSSD